MKKILFSTDVDILQSTLVVNDADTNKENNCFYLVQVDADKFQVHTFDLVNSLHDEFWDLDDIASFVGFDYRNVPSEERDLDFWAHLTDDICSYYGAINFSDPQLIEADKLEEYIKN